MVSVYDYVNRTYKTNNKNNEQNRTEQTSKVHNTYIVTYVKTKTRI